MARELLYSGLSMNPLLQPGDVLQVVPYEGRKIREGDVVVFPYPRTRMTMVHRVVAVNSSGVITKGDNNSALDDWVLKPSYIVGQVAAIRRAGQIFPVPREVPASLYLLKARQWFSQASSRLLQPVYHRLAQSGLFHGYLAAWMKPRLLYFPRSEGHEWQLWLGSLLIGRKLPTQSYWTIRRPFRLFVDLTSLPCQPTPHPGRSH
jgi:signal peptidase I